LKTNEPFEFEPKHLHRNALWIDSKLTSNITCQEAKEKTSKKKKKKRGKKGTISSLNILLKCSSTSNL
jgi:hypothetical protein